MRSWDSCRAFIFIWDLKRLSKAFLSSGFYTHFFIRNRLLETVRPDFQNLRNFGKRFCVNQKSKGTCDFFYYNKTGTGQDDTNRKKVYGLNIIYKNIVNISPWHTGLLQDWHKVSRKKGSGTKASIVNFLRLNYIVLNQKYNCHT